MEINKLDFEEEIIMNCPFCNKEMIKGVITGDGRAKVRWYADGEIDPIESTFTEKGCIDANYTLTKFSMDGFYCKECKKMIFNTDIKK